MVCKFAFDDDAKTAHLKKNVGPVFAVNVDCLAVGGYAVA